MRTPRAFMLALGLVVLAGCWGREPLDFRTAYTADPTRGERLYLGNCAKTCHPADAFAVKSVTSYDDLAYTVRDYYRLSVKDPRFYTPQDVFDLVSYLNRTHYHFPQRIEGRKAP